MKTLQSPSFNVCPALYPIATLKQVSASEAAPASVPAYMFSCASGPNPVIVTVALAPEPVAVTPGPTKSIEFIPPDVPTALPSSFTVIPPILSPIILVIFCPLPQSS